MAKKILLADDSITIQKVVELTFSDGDYEVIAVNNGAKAIQKLSEMRPDIILSDIIMPEKNGYEVCEFVKSRPEFKSIPVILLTGTFEPFDPDRADKAGCDAVVTKPFESQSLIHKVDELIQQSAAAPPAAAARPELPVDQKPTLVEPAPSYAPPAAPSFAPPAASPFAEDNANDIFGAVPPAEPNPADLPFETAPAEAFSSETRAFTRMSFEDLQKAAAPPAPAPAPPPPAAPQPSPWDEAPPLSAATTPFPPMAFEEMPKPAAAPAADASPWEEPPAFSGETRAIPKMSFEDLQRAAAEQPAPPPPAAEPSPWDEQPATGGETRAFQRMSFDDLQKAAAPAAPEPPAPMPPPAPAPMAEPSPWDEQPPAAFSGETKTFPKMSFDDLQKMAESTPMPEPEAPRSDSSLWDEPAASAPSWAAAEPPAETPAAAESFSTPAASPFGESTEREESPFGMGAPEPAAAPSEPEPSWSASADESPSVTSVAGAAAPAASAAATEPGELTDDQIDRIARRVVQLMSQDVVKNIAWEVIPDLAEMVVRERVRQLESES